MHYDYNLDDLYIGCIAVEGNSIGNYRIFNFCGLP
jgi:hypothetical protein